MVYSEEAPDRAAACRREYQIKQLSSREKRALISHHTMG
jgi:predicted GIY-YIG superfamily endonuclease